MLVRLGKVLVVFALVATLGAHWALLQTVAWTTMLASNLQSESLHDAMVKTFDGQHPCALCKVIAKAKKSSKKAEYPQTLTKFEFPLAAQCSLFVALAPFDPVPTADVFVESLPQRPPTPPPRLTSA